MSSQNTYTAENIRVLSDLEHIRKNPGMYIGSVETPSQLISEVIDNAIDEVINHDSDGFEVVVNTSDDGITYIVTDHGYGIPAGYKEIDGKQLSILETLITKSNSGGKFDDKAYLSSAGVHGLGITCVNALADEVFITSVSNGQKGSIHTINGEPVNKVEYLDTDEKSGTSFGFTIKSDNAYFDSKEIPIQFIFDKLNVYQAYGIKNIKFSVDGESRELTAHTPLDLYPHADKLKHKDNYKPAITTGDNIIEVQTEKGEKLSVAFEYTSETSTSSSFHGFVNFVTCNQGGHISAVQRAIQVALYEFCRDRNIKEPSDFPSDYYIGINVVCSCNIINKQFSSQTKERLITGTGSTWGYFNKLVQLLSTEINKNVFSKNVGVTKALLKRVADYRERLNKQSELRGLSQYVKVNDSTDSLVRRGSVYEKLVECTNKNRDECELIILEGDSAMSGLLRLRDKTKTALLPLKGKLKNVVGVSPIEALKNKEIAGIVNSVGTGILNNCNIDRIRYANILYLGDSDADGKHICNLITALFVNYLPDVVKEGRFHMLTSPLYTYKENGVWSGTDDFDEMPDEIREKQAFTRIKGIGEMNDDQLQEFVLNPDKRNLVTVDYPSDLDEFNHIMSTIAGRRKLVIDSGLLVE